VIRVCVLIKSSARRANKATAAPSAASRSAVAWPRPLLAPVTTATRPDSGLTDGALTHGTLAQAATELTIRTRTSTTARQVLPRPGKHELNRRSLFAIIVRPDAACPSASRRPFCFWQLACRARRGRVSPLIWMTTIIQASDLSS
jgi:hypothetical protein